MPAARIPPDRAHFGPDGFGIERPPHCVGDGGAEQRALYGGHAAAQQFVAERLLAAREARYETAQSAAVAATRSVYDAESERIARLATEIGLERFSDPLQDLDSRLARAIEVAKARLEILSIERTLGGAAHVAGQGLTAPLSDQKKKDFAARLALLRANIGEPATEPAQRPEGALPEAVERALAAADAQPLPKKASPEKLRAELLESIDEMEAGRYELAELLETNRKEASYQANLKAKTAHDALLVELYRTAQNFAAVAAQETTLRMTLPSLGLTARSDILPTPGALMQAILILGSDADYGSALSEFRRWLESRDLLR